MRKTILLLTLIYIAFSITSCKKYEEGPALSVRSKKARVSANWDVDEFTIDGQNMLSQSGSGSYLCVLGSYVPFTQTATLTIEWEMEKDGDFTIQLTSYYKLLDETATFNNCVAYYSNTQDVTTATGSWKFKANKEDLHFVYDDGTAPETYEIVKLKEKEMKLEGIINGDTYRFTLTKQ